MVQAGDFYPHQSLCKFLSGNTAENKKFKEELQKDKYISKNFINSLLEDKDVDDKIFQVQDLLKGETYSELNNYYKNKATKEEKNTGTVYVMEQRLLRN